MDINIRIPILHVLPWGSMAFWVWMDLTLFDITVLVGCHFESLQWNVNMLPVNEEMSESFVEMDERYI